MDNQKTGRRISGSASSFAADAKQRATDRGKMPEGAPRNVLTRRKGVRDLTSGEIGDALRNARAQSDRPSTRSAQPQQGKTGRALDDAAEASGPSVARPGRKANAVSTAEKTKDTGKPAQATVGEALSPNVLRNPKDSPSPLASPLRQAATEAPGVSGPAVEPGTPPAANAAPSTRPASAVPSGIREQIDPDLLGELAYSYSELSDDEITALGALIELWVAEEDALQNILDFRADSGTSKSDLLSYCLFRAIGIDIDRDSTDGTPAAVFEASSFQEALALDPGADPFSRKFLRLCYCALRSLGNTPEVSGGAAWSGPLCIAHLVANHLEFVAGLFEATGLFPDGPMYPRIDCELLAEPVILGRGGFNEVIALTAEHPVTGAQAAFAFKPSKANAKFGLGGTLTAINPARFWPETRNMAALAIARIFGLAGRQGVVGDMFMGLVDNEPGLFMEVASGRPVATHFYQKTIRPGNPHHDRLMSMRTALQDPAINRAQSDILGVHSIRFEGDVIMLAGSADPPVNDPEALQFQQAFQEDAANDNPSLKRAYAQLQVFNYLINDSDTHPGNTFLSRGPDGRYRAMRIDLDQCMGKALPDLSGREDAFMEYYIAMLPTHIDAKLYERLRKASRERLRDTLEDLGLGRTEIRAFERRINDLLKAVRQGSVLVVDSDAGWTSADMSDPHEHLLARDLMRMT